MSEPKFMRPTILIILAVLVAIFVLAIIAQRALSQPIGTSKKVVLHSAPRQPFFEATPIPRQLAEVIDKHRREIRDEALTWSRERTRSRIERGAELVAHKSAADAGRWLRRRLFHRFSWVFVDMHSHRLAMACGVGAVAAFRLTDSRHAAIQSCVVNATREAWRSWERKHRRSVRGSSPR
jgi:hypothetical protein